MIAAVWAFVSGNVRTLAIAASLIVAAYLGGQHVGAVHEREIQRAATAKVAVAAEKLQRAADRVASTARETAETTITTDRKEVDNALAPIPDQAPTARQRTRACIELRRQAAAAGEPSPSC